MTKKSGIYGWRCTDSGKWYIGQSVDVEARRSNHLSCLRGGYGFNGYLQAAFNKHGEESFEFHVLEETPEDILDVRERTWIAYLKSTDPVHGYNLDSGGKLHKRHSAITRAKMSESNKGKHSGPISAEHRANISAAQMGKKRGPFSEEHRAALSAAHKGQGLSPEHRAKVTAALTGRAVSEETRAKISASNIGQKRSQETRDNISAAQKGKKRKPLSDETKAKIGASNRGKTRSSEVRASISKRQKGKIPSADTMAKLQDGWKKYWASKQGIVAGDNPCL